MSNQMVNRLKTLKLDNFLLAASTYILRFFTNGEAFIEENLSINNGYFVTNGQIRISAWGLSDLIYYAIKETNDFNHKNINLQEFKELYNEYLRFDNEKSKDYIRENDNKDIFRVLLGLSQQEFYYQEVFRIPQEYTRNYQLYCVIPKEIQTSINLAEICKEKTGFSDEELWLLLQMLLVMANSNIDITDMKVDVTVTQKNPLFTDTNIKKVIEYFTANYQEYRKTSLKEKYFTIKPIIRTNKNMLIIINIFSLAKRVSEGSLWVLRDYFNEKGSQEYVTEIGKWFEYYVKQLLEHYLGNTQYERLIETGSEPIADWIIYSKNYQVIIEQKASLANASIKRQYPDREQLDRYLIKMKQGYKQLDNTAKKRPDKRKTLKILILLENFFIADGLLKPLLEIEDK